MVATPKPLKFSQYDPLSVDYRRRQVVEDPWPTGGVFLTAVDVVVVEAHRNGALLVVTIALTSLDESSPDVPVGHSQRPAS